MIRLRALTFSRTSSASAVAVAEQIADADAAPSDLVLVRRPDAARGRADLPFAAPRFGQHVELAVIRQDHVRLLADQQPAVHGDAQPRQLVDLLEERLRIDDDAVADDAGDAGMQDARRDQMQDELLARARTPYVRRCGRPDSARPPRSAASACRRSCPCLRRPTARPALRCWSHSAYIVITRLRRRSSEPDAMTIATRHDRNSTGRSLTLDDLVASPMTMRRCADRRRARARPRRARASSTSSRSATSRPTASTPASATSPTCAIPRDSLDDAAAQSAAQPRRGRWRTAAGAGRARDDGAARERAGQGLLGHPARDARPAHRAAQPRRASASFRRADRSARAATSRRSRISRWC